MGIPYRDIAITLNGVLWHYFPSVKAASLWLAKLSGVNDWRKTRWGIYKVLEGYTRHCYGFEVFANRPPQYKNKKLV